MTSTFTRLQRRRVPSPSSIRPTLRLTLCSSLLALALGCGSEGSGGSPNNNSGGSAGTSAVICDEDQDGFDGAHCGGDDCDDGNSDIHPNAEDVCDGDDNDCDGDADPGEACDCRDQPPEPTLPFTDRVCLAGGWFWMGMAYTDPHAAAQNYVASPAHEVFVSPYFMDAYEVTNRRYIECLDAGACSVSPPQGLPNSGWERDDNSTEEELDKPFWGASFFDARDFCVWAGGRLPSEAEWERAAAGLHDFSGDELLGPRPYPHGNSPPTCEEAWVAPCIDSGDLNPLAQRVGLLTPNPEGLYDMAGNVREMVLDPWSRLAYEECDRCKNPCFGCAELTGGPPELGFEGRWPWSRVVRGGSARTVYSEDPNVYRLVRSQFRDFAPGSNVDESSAPRLFNVGFRCVYPAEPKR